jgi:DNA-directed RNA polymerase subunit N (RpoN/RPB10)
MDIECDVCGEVFGEEFHSFTITVEVTGEAEKDFVPTRFVHRCLDCAREESAKAKKMGLRRLDETLAKSKEKWRW